MSTHESDHAGSTPPSEIQRQGLAVLAVLVGVGYLGLRLSTLGRGPTLVLSLLFLLTELWAVVELALLTFNGWTVKSRPVLASATEGDDLLDSRALGSTDVIVTADGADPELVERSLIGTTALIGRGTVTVVDSVLRPEVAAAVEPFPAVYIVDEQLAAGRVGRLTAHGATDLLLWLRAGQVPMPSLLSVLVPRFHDANLAVCQSAVEPLNASSLVHLRGGRDDEALVRQVTGPGRDRFGAGPWAGPGSVVRRRAIDGIDWAGVDGPAEVGQVHVELLSTGWQSAYDGAGLVKEAAAETLGRYLEDRRDQARNAWSLFLSARSPLRAPALSWRYRAALLADVEPHLRGTRYMLQTLFLLLAMISGWLPIDRLTLPLVAGWLAAFGSGMFARRTLGRGSMVHGDWVRHGWRTVEADLHALGDVVLHGGRWSRTRTGGVGGGLAELGRLWFLTSAVIAVDLALLARGLTLINVSLLPRMDSWERALVISVALMGLVPMVDVLQFVVGGRQRRSQYRLQTTRPIMLFESKAKTIDLSPAGVGVRLRSTPEVGATSPFILSLPGLDGVRHEVMGTAIVRVVGPKIDGVNRVGLEFTELDPDARLVIMAYCVVGQEAAVHRSEHALSAPGHLRIERSTGHHRGLQGVTGLAVAAGICVLMQGPVSASGLLDEPPAQRVCVVHSSGAAAIATAVAKPGVVDWEPAGETGDDGCLTVDGSSPTYAVAQGAGFIQGSADADGLAMIQLPARAISVIDRNRAPVAVAVRYFTAEWLEAPADASPGVSTIASELSPSQIELSVNGFRHVVDFTGADLTVRLSTIVADAGLEVVEINRSTDWTPFASGGEVLPGRVAVRLSSGQVAKIEVPEGVEISVPSGAVQPLP